MKNIYIIFDNSPTEFDEKTVVGMKWYFTKKEANQKLRRLKEEDPYTYQYCEITKLQLEVS